MTDTTIELLAGLDPQQQHIIEMLPVTELEQGQYRLLKSPAFVKSLASGDTIAHIPGTYTFTIIERSGNLCVRVLSKTPELMTQKLADFEKLGANLDTKSARMLVYSIHVSCGFEAIEACLNKACGPEDLWVYGNVYDPSDNTPLNWWQAILAPQ